MTTTDSRAGGADRAVDPGALRGLLEDSARAGATRTYQQVATALGLEPPQTIHRVAVALEHLMSEDAAAGRPLLATVVVSRTRDGLPAPGFFAHARALGRYAGPDTGPEAAAFHAEELAAVRAYYSKES